MVQYTRIGMEFAVGILVMFALFSIPLIPSQPIVAGGSTIVLLALAGVIAVYGLRVGEHDSLRNVLMMGAAGALFTLFILFVYISGFSVNVAGITFVIMFLPAAYLFMKNMESRQRRLGMRG